MRVICVGGLSSGSGKTSVACLLLSAFPGWAAMKVTPSRPGHVCPLGSDCGACEPPHGDYEVLIDAEIPERPGKDTRRFLEAGASHVAFVRALPENLPKALEATLDRFPGVPGAIVESTTAMPFIDGLHIMVAREDWSEVKDSARKCKGLIDLLLVNRDSSDPQVTSDDCSPLEAELRPRHTISACAVLPPDHPRNRDLIDYCRRSTSA